MLKRRESKKVSGRASALTMAGVLPDEEDFWMSNSALTMAELLPDEEDC